MRIEGASKTSALLHFRPVNDRLGPGYTWIPRYAALIGHYGHRDGPSVDELERLISHSFDDFLLLMPGRTASEIVLLGIGRQEC
ncbi:hypothetical protein [Streptomonospora wellingtoniae]|uniref:Uncharacterized protein n=1 Tax=Streptomonospora wellingtoniae TaxID=3075544 RepID=A0ABU2KPX4_9ACTN|nr:hypothetical protein [Streptomonospora sp. DSM 45055]MDT0301308.1 hypothetical protein [Streptomonospora sp. DSM 45055]